MVTPTEQPTDRQGEYRAICFFEGWKMEGRDLHYENSPVIIIDLKKFSKQRLCFSLLSSSRVTSRLS